MELCIFYFYLLINLTLIDFRYRKEEVELKAGSQHVARYEEVCGLLYNESITLMWPLSNKLCY